MDGAPLRAITVKDAIGDLPPIVNGSDMLEMPYSGARLPMLPYSSAGLTRHSRPTQELVCPGMTYLCFFQGLACGGLTGQHGI